MILKASEAFLGMVRKLNSAGTGFTEARALGGRPFKDDGKGSGRLHTALHGRLETNDKDAS